MSLRLTSIRSPPSPVVLEVRAKSLPEEHRVMPFKDPFARPVTQGPGRLVRLQAIKRPVVGKVEQDHVVEIPAVGDVVPAEEPDPELLVVLLHLAREDRLHEELEERVSTTADGEEGREHRDE